jgi:hypothetical protein
VQELALLFGGAPVEHLLGDLVGKHTYAGDAPLLAEGVIGEVEVMLLSRATVARVNGQWHFFSHVRLAGLVHAVEQGHEATADSFGLHAAYRLVAHVATRKQGLIRQVIIGQAVFWPTQQANGCGALLENLIQSGLRRSQGRKLRRRYWVSQSRLAGYTCPR